ncbi:hypothetical protein N7533_002632 [Penicillium manginii]|uniref:uncharacterized protein n=1 Tax=Penicillium manginii TaxID=203109 RepID=UPI002548A63B|nr:uncharacterized protein N7533_002632 [Penicillium manginii]KAJ5763951.1 hypothetical protein N7533_002632 [Penicillium manginii]
MPPLHGIFLSRLGSQPIFSAVVETRLPEPITHLHHGFSSSQLQGTFEEWGLGRNTMVGNDWCWARDTSADVRRAQMEPCPWIGSANLNNAD